jgi:hypothetical protein
MTTAAARAAEKQAKADLAKRLALGWKDDVHHRHADGLEHAHNGSPEELHNCDHDGKHWQIDLVTGRHHPCAWCVANKGPCPKNGLLIPESRGDNPEHEHQYEPRRTRAQIIDAEKAFKALGYSKVQIKKLIALDSSGVSVWSEHDGQGAS